MHDIKTYNQVVHGSERIAFRISRMEDIWEARKGVKDDPHRHDYYTLLIVKKARGCHVVDFNSYPLAPNQVWFISPGQVHQVTEEEQSFGYAVLFSPGFLAENNIPAYFIDDLNLFNNYGHSPPLAVDPEEFRLLSSFCEEILRIERSDMKFRNQAIASYLKLILIRSNNLCTLSPENTQIQEAGNTILKRFRELVDEKYAEWQQVSRYAEELNVTPDHLNRVVKSLVGKTAKEYIHARIMLSAKRLLYFSGLSAKEIGYKLGFSEPANFSAFFKKNSGQSPTLFRNHR